MPQPLTTTLRRFSPQLAIAGFWAFWTLLHTAIIFHSGFRPQTAFIDAVVSNTLLLCFVVLLANNFNYFNPRQGRFPWIAGVVAMGTFIWISGTFKVLFFVFTNLVNEPGYLDMLAHTRLLRIAFGLLIFLLTCAICTLWYNMVDEVKQSERKQEAEKLARDAELNRLHLQLQPHFLFNSLNSINALIAFNPNEARNMVQKLSEFLRGTLRKNQEELVTIEEEVKHLQLYLDIEKVRFGHRLNVDFSYGENCEGLKLPALLLQPIVENAIKFGLYDTLEPVTISIEVTCVKSMLVCSVTNPYDPVTATPGKGTGFGINAIKRRLYLNFGRSDLFSTEADNALFKSTIRIPQRND